MAADKKMKTDDVNPNEAEVDETEEVEDYEETTGSKLLKIAIIFFLLTVFIVGGFALGLYFKLYDMEQVNEKLGLYEYPVLNWYFEKPLSVIAAEEQSALEKAVEEAQAAEAAKKAQEEEKRIAEEKAKEKEKELEDAANGIEKPKPLTKEELTKQIQERRAAEKKRVTKLARLYENMKPADAATILGDLEDDIVIDIFNRMDEGKVSKILNEFDESRSARLTRIMYIGKPNVSHVR